MGEGAAGALVRHGEYGCWLAMRGAPPEHVAPYSVEPIDTNGAGDTHIGSFIAALGAGDTPLAAARFANAAAALSTLHKGPATAPDRSQTEAFMAANAPDPASGNQQESNREKQHETYNQTDSGDGDCAGA